jgi:hypothetical protein
MFNVGVANIDVIFSKYIFKGKFAIKSLNNVNGLNYNTNNIKKYFKSLNKCVLMILKFDLK